MKKSKLFVLDTNVLLHDPECLFNFQDNDIALPLIVLEELDNHKKGMSEVSRNARQANRVLDMLLTKEPDLTKGIDLSEHAPSANDNNKKTWGRLFFITDTLTDEDWAGLSDTSNDNQILAVVHQQARLNPKKSVILVSKDINIRVKAMALGMKSEDYRTDQAINDSELLYSGFHEITEAEWGQMEVESWVKEGKTHYRIAGAPVTHLQANQAVFMTSPEPIDEAKPAHSYSLRVSSINHQDKKATAELTAFHDYSNERNAVWGVAARNREQNVALNLLMDPNIDLVTLLGAAGTGKTLITLAAAIAQVFDSKRYEDIIITRATVPIGDDIGFLPGTEEEKMNPWMGALEDNLQVLTRPKNHAKDGVNNNASASTPKHGNALTAPMNNLNTTNQWSDESAQEYLRSRIKVKSLSFMRGRTFVDRFLIIDEAQNLTPPQLKSLITRAGMGTKVVCLGNLAQIDTPYLTPLTSGLTWLVERFRSWPHSGHIVLQRGERSRLADYAEEALSIN